MRALILADVEAPVEYDNFRKEFYGILKDAELEFLNQYLFFFRLEIGLVNYFLKWCFLQYPGEHDVLYFFKHEKMKEVRGIDKVLDNIEKLSKKILVISFSEEDVRGGSRFGIKKYQSEWR